jgi:N-methylhydantoinase B/oxoprolinase/acetone carboxylase alpha subunit
VRDAADLQILAARLASVADEMGAVLRRAAYSPNIKERADCSAALFTAAGELLVQAEHIPVHLGSMPASARAAIDHASTRGGARPGDEVLLNDPFAGGTHLNDVTLLSPCFADDGVRLVGWVATRAHHADVGGIAPGSMPPDARTIDEEGLRIPPTVVTPDLVERFVRASRTPEERRGDLLAQRGANRVGVMRFRELVAALGAGGDARFDALLDYGERRMRAGLEHGFAGRAGQWTFEDVLDSAGPRPEQQHPSVIRCTVTYAGGEVTFDFSGTSPQSPGNVHAVEAVTVSAVEFALRAALDPTIPANGGAMRPVRVLAPAGTVVHALPPVAVGAGNVEVSQRVADVCLGALARALPGAVGAASQGTMNNLLVGSDGAGPAWVYYETIGGGQGARPWADGMSGVQSNMTNTLDTPVEALERELPLRVRRSTLRRGSGGPGARQGGDGTVRELEVLADAVVSLVTERRVSRPWGLAGGGPGAAGENWLLPGGDESRAERLGDKVTVHLRSGDVVRILTPGGGGYGGAADD